MAQVIEMREAARVRTGLIEFIHGFNQSFLREALCLRCEPESMAPVYLDHDVIVGGRYALCKL